MCVKFIDVRNVVGSNSSNRLGGTGKGDGSVVFIIVGCELGAAILSNVSRAGILCEGLYTHGRVEEVGNITGEGGIDAVADCFLD